MLTSASARNVDLVCWFRPGFTGAWVWRASESLRHLL